eukprot:3754655-Prymnesium_polylepis.1
MLFETHDAAVRSAGAAALVDGPKPGKPQKVTGSSFNAPGARPDLRGCALRTRGVFGEHWRPDLSTGRP